MQVRIRSIPHCFVLHWVQEYNRVHRRLCSYMPAKGGKTDEASSICLPAHREEAWQTLLMRAWSLPRRHNERGKLYYNSTSVHVRTIERPEMQQKTKTPNHAKVWITPMWLGRLLPATNYASRVGNAALRFTSNSSDTGHWPHCTSGAVLLYCAVSAYTIYPWVWNSMDGWMPAPKLHTITKLHIWSCIPQTVICNVWCFVLKKFRPPKKD